MRVARRGVLTVVIASVLLIGAAGPALASDDPARPDGAASAAQISFPTDDESTINATQEFRLTPTRPGEVTVQVRFSIPSRVITLRTEVPAGAQVTRTDGFHRENGETYSWDESTSHPSITYTLPVNESLNDTSPEGADGDLVAVDAGDWALFQRPPTPVQWENYASEDPIEYNQTATTAGPGATGEWLVFLGDHQTYERTAHDQQFRLVVPSTANMTAPPWRVLNSLTHASDALRVGDRDEAVFVVAAPTDGVQWGVRGLQTGEADLWVRDVEPVASPDNPWVHEYVHSRQGFTLASDMRWFREASASYYAALLTYEQSHIRYDGFRNRIGTGANSSYANAVLANQSTWGRNPHYDKGALVAGQLDRQIRTAHDGDRTLQTVMGAMNNASDRITLSEFLGYLHEYGADSVVDAGERYAGTASNVSMWNQTAHVMAFGDPPARFEFRLPDDERNGSYAVSSSYRNESVDAGEDPIVLVPGERLEVDAPVENTGGRTGEYTASLEVNGTIVDRTRGTLAPNETGTVALNHTFPSPGTYEIALGEDNRTVAVREPAQARATDLTAASREVVAGESVVVSARVENDAALPGETTVVFRRDDGQFVVEETHVAPESETWVDATIATSRTGDTTVSVHGAGSVEIAVRSPPDTETRTAGTPAVSLPEPTPQPPTSDATTDDVAGTSVPVFGGVTVTLAVAIATGLALFRQRR